LCLPMRVTIGLLYLILCSVTYVFCWGFEGHRVVAAIAQSLFTSTTQTATSIWLGPRVTIVDIAPQADVYRSTPQGRWSAPLHFVNLPLSATQFDMKRDCKQDECVVGAIMNYTHILSVTPPHFVNSSDWNSMEPSPLAFLVHFVGDIHQPLHVAYAEDLGGNERKVEFFVKDTQLHAVWDTLILEKTGKDWKTLSQEYIDEIQTNPGLINKYASVMDPKIWANESFSLMIRHPYNILPESDGDNKRLPYLAEHYFRDNYPIVKRQLIAGGIRLGTLLNTIFKKNAFSSSSASRNSPSKFLEVYLSSLP
jgi:hypothetical protein